jgi:putative DNA primase/helicase
MTRKRTPGREGSKGAKGGDAKPKVDAAAIILHVVEPEVVRGTLELFRTPSRVAFATVKIRDHFENHALDSAEFKDLLCYWIFKTMGEMPSAATLSKTLGTLRGRALYDATSVECPVHHRLAEANGSIFVDRCDEPWRVDEITAAGWWLKENPPVRFIRSAVSRPLPAPERGGDVFGIFDFVNISRRDHQVLFVAWLVGALQTHASYPILMLTGSQGSAKTTACKIAAALIDPAEPALVSGYSSERDLLVDSQSSHVIAIDNLSEIKDSFSDALCRLATGSGMRRRKLYSDSTLFALSAKNPLILNSISTVATRGDLLDRMITLKLDPIPEDRRREEAKVFAEFKAKRPAILGALLTAVSAALAKLPHLKVEKQHLPRMADFATWIIACEKELGFMPGEFLKAYTLNRQEASDATLEFSTIGLPVISLVDASSGSWQGSIKDLLLALNSSTDELSRRDPNWPKSEKALASALSRIDANLHAAGLDMQWLKLDSRTRRRIVRITKMFAPVEFPAAYRKAAGAQ